MDMVLDDLMHGEAIRMSLLDPTHILCFFRLQDPQHAPKASATTTSGTPRETPLDKKAENEVLTQGPTLQRVS